MFLCFVLCSQFGRDHKTLRTKCKELSTWIFQHGNKRQVAISFRKIQPITDDKLIRYRKTKVVDLYFTLPPLMFVEQRRELHACRTTRLQVGE